jgi:uncharacterized protein YecE (DUF72 family)
VEEWLDRLTRYLAAGHSVYFMVHCPNKQRDPALAEDFHNALRARVSLPPLPAWPLPRQDSLF